MSTTMCLTERPSTVIGTTFIIDPEIETILPTVGSGTLSL
jgi:hypothetical protein